MSQLDAFNIMFISVSISISVVDACLCVTEFLDFMKGVE